MSTPNDDISDVLRLEVLDRDNWQCVVCGTGGENRLHLHHVIYRSQGGESTRDNLATVCHRCHRRIHDGYIRITLIATPQGEFWWTSFLRQP